MKKEKQMRTLCSSQCAFCKTFSTGKNNPPYTDLKVITTPLSLNVALLPATASLQLR